MPLQIRCGSCSSAIVVPDGSEGKVFSCPACKSRIMLPAPGAIQPNKPSQYAEPDPVEREPIGANVNPRSYHRLRRELRLVQLRQRARMLCFLGDSVGERIACAFIVAVVPFCISFGVSLAVKQPGMYAALQGVGSFIIVATFFSLLVIRGGTDEALEARHVQIMQELPLAREAWFQFQERIRAQRAAAERRVWAEAEYQTQAPPIPDDAQRRCPFCAEIILAAARKCKHCGEMLDEVSTSRRLSRSARPRPSEPARGESRSGAVAAMLELIFGLFLATFGIGHIYAGDVVGGLLILFLWWLFVAANVIASFFTCGVWAPIALIIVPAAYFLMLVVSPLSAASYAGRR